MFRTSLKLELQSTYSPGAARTLPLNGTQNATSFFKAGKSLVGIIYDGKKLAYFDTDTTSASALPGVRNNEDFSENQGCFDALYNSKNSKVFFVCVDSVLTPSQAKVDLIFLNIIDYNSGISDGRKVFDLPESTTVSAAVRLGIYRTADEAILLIYNQGNPYTGSVDNKLIYVCTNIDEDFESIECESKIDLTKSNAMLSVFHDVFPTKDGLVLTGLDSKSGKLKTVYCDVDVAKLELKCENTPKIFDTTTGYIGVLSMNRYFVFNGQTNTLQICPSVNNWAATCMSPVALSIPAGLFIRDAELNNGVILLSLYKSQKGGGVYSGYIMYDIAAERIIPGLANTAAVIYDRTLLYRNIDDTDSIYTTRIAGDHLLIDPKNFTQGTPLRNFWVLVSASDDKTTKVSTLLNITVLDDYIGKSWLTNATFIPEFDILWGSYLRWPMDSQNFLGNGLTFSIDHIGDISKSIDKIVYQTNRTDIALTTGRPEDATGQNLTDFMVGDGYLIGIDISNRIEFFSCDYPGLLNILCTRKYMKQLTDGKKYSILQAGKFTDGLYYAVLNIQGGSTTLFLMTKDNKGIFTSSSVNLSFEVISASGFMSHSQEESNVYPPTLALVVKRNPSDGGDYVTFYQADSSSGNFQPWSTDITKDKVEGGSFCPTKVYGSSDGTLYLSSLCKSESRVFVYHLPNIDAPISETPISKSVEVKNVCVYGDQILVAGTTYNPTKTVLYLTGIGYNYDTKEYFGTKDYQFPDVFEVQCLDNSNLFSISFTNSSSKDTTYAFFYSKSSGRANKRLHSVLTGQTVKLRPSVIPGQMLMSGFDSPGSIYAVTALDDAPYIYADASGAPGAANDVGVEFNDNPFAMNPFVYQNGTYMTNSPRNEYHQVMTSIRWKNTRRDQVLFRFPTNIALQDYTIKVSPQAVGEFTASKTNLETALHISGPVRSVYLTGVSSDKAVIQPRIRELSTSMLNPMANYGPVEFISYQDSDNLTIAMRQSIDSINSQMIIDAYKDETSSFSLTIGIASRVKAFTAVKSVASNEIVIVFAESMNIRLGKYELKAAFITPQNTLRKTVLVGQIKAEEIQIYQTSSQFFVLTRNEEGVTLFRYKAGDTFDKTYTIPELRVFSVYNNGTDFVVAGAKRDSFSIEFYQFNPSDTTKLSKAPYCFDQYRRMQLLSLTCTPYKSDSVVCLANVVGAYILEFYFSFTNPNPEIYFHTKFYFYEVYSLAYAGDYIVAQAATSRPRI
jgi:hypothetical protein